jgi:hypothetical protein
VSLARYAISDRDHVASLDIAASDVPRQEPAAADDDDDDECAADLVIYSPAAPARLE